MFKVFLKSIVALSMAAFMLTSCSDEEIMPTEESMAFSSNGDEVTREFTLSDLKLTITADESFRDISVDGFSFDKKENGKRPGAFDAKLATYVKRRIGGDNQNKGFFYGIFESDDHVFIINKSNGKFIGLKKDNGSGLRANGSYVGDASGIIVSKSKDEVTKTFTLEKLELTITADESFRDISVDGFSFDKKENGKRPGAFDASLAVYVKRRIGGDNQRKGRFYLVFESDDHVFIINKAKDKFIGLKKDNGSGLRANSSFTGDLL